MKLSNNKINFSLKWSSSLIGRASYIGFFIDWFIESISILVTCIVFVSSGSSYFGIFLYINGMVRDMKMQLMSNGSLYCSKSESNEALKPTKESCEPLKQMELWRCYVRELKFHIEIMGYFKRFKIFKSRMQIFTLTNPISPNSD